ncbi:MAG: bifunctional UDP-sugar hydrolase/5'-nucleotidase [Verrucomicrobiota bacterium]|nr:bifunctional UDP-sugar hydrolase/5'-nucleotidase [Verrucomicrobiota bacterium]
MPKYNKIIFAVFLSFFFCSFISSEVVEVKIYQTTDIHSHIDSSSHETDVGGWLRIGTVIREKQSSYGKKNLLLIDCGDTLEGAFSGVISQGEAGGHLLDIYNYDVWVPGNHEFDFGIKKFLEISENMKCTILNANLLYNGKKLFPGFKIFHKNGAKIAVIGVNASFLKNWFWGRRYQGIGVLKAVDAIGVILEKIAVKKVDMIILAMHHGYLEKDLRGVNEVVDIAMRYPQIDLLLGGHTHIERPGMQIGKSWYVQAGCHGEFLGEITAMIDTEKHEVKKISSILLPMTEDIPKDKVNSVYIQEILKKQKNMTKQVVGSCKKDISAKGLPGINSQISELLCLAIKEETKADIIFHGSLSNHTLSGKITKKDVFLTVPYENTIGTVLLTKNEIKKIIKEQINYILHWSFQGIYGCNIIYNRQNNTVKMDFSKKMQEQKFFSVSFNSYVISSGGGRFPVLKSILKNKKIKETKLDSRKILEKYISKYSPLEIKIKQWMKIEE